MMAKKSWKKHYIGPILAAGLALIVNSSYPLRGPPEYYVSQRVEKETIANLKLYDFPSVIPGAKAVDKYMTPGAGICLVHIRNFHSGKTVAGDIEKTIEAVQNDVFQIINHLHSYYGLEEIYAEGVDEYNISIINQKVWTHRGIIKSIEKESNDLAGRIAELESSLALETDPDIARRHKEELSREMEYLTLNHLKCSGLISAKKEEYKDDATMKAAYILGIGIKSSEDRLLHERALDFANFLIFGKEDSRIPQAIYDDREDEALRLIAESEKPFAVLVYGGGHSFGGKESFGENYDHGKRKEYKDNISDWKMRNPNLRFSLIEVTPSSYPW